MSVDKVNRVMVELRRHNEEMIRVLVDMLPSLPHNNNFFMKQQPPAGSKAPLSDKSSKDEIQDEGFNQLSLKLTKTLKLPKL